MFTGIIEELGIVEESGPKRLVIGAEKVLEGTKVGDSIAVNGACLTVTSLGEEKIEVDVMPETLRRSNLGKLRYGDKVNLERALMLGSRIGGHLVLGHVDDTGLVELMIPEEAASIMKVSAPRELMPYIVSKGFIAVDGVSLTIINVDNFSFAISLVTYSLEHTTLGSKRPGDMVNLEIDVIARYLEGLKEQKSESITGHLSLVANY